MVEIVKAVETVDTVETEKMVGAVEIINRFVDAVVA